MDDPVHETLVRDLTSGEFLEHQRNVVLIAGTGTGKSHLAMSIARACIRRGKRGRFFNLADLVNTLDAEARNHAMEGAQACPTGLASRHHLARKLRL